MEAATKTGWLSVPDKGAPNRAPASQGLGALHGPGDALAQWWAFNVFNPDFSGGGADGFPRRPQWAGQTVDDYLSGRTRAELDPLWLPFGPVAPDPTGTWTLRLVNSTAKGKAKIRNADAEQLQDYGVTLARSQTLGRWFLVLRSSVPFPGLDAGARVLCRRDGAGLDPVQTVMAFVADNAARAVGDSGPAPGASVPFRVDPASGEVSLTVQRGTLRKGAARERFGARWTGQTTLSAPRWGEGGGSDLVFRPSELHAVARQALPIGCDLQAALGLMADQLYGGNSAWKAQLIAGSDSVTTPPAAGASAASVPAPAPVHAEAEAAAVAIDMAEHTVALGRAWSHELGGWAWYRISETQPAATLVRDEDRQWDRVAAWNRRTLLVAAAQSLPRLFKDAERLVDTSRVLKTGQIVTIGGRTDVPEPACPATACPLVWLARERVALVWPMSRITASGVERVDARPKSAILSIGVLPPPLVNDPRVPAGLWEAAKPDPADPVPRVRELCYWMWLGLLKTARAGGARVLVSGPLPRLGRHASPEQRRTANEASASALAVALSALEDPHIVVLCLPDDDDYGMFSSALRHLFTELPHAVLLTRNVRARDFAYRVALADALEAADAPVVALAYQMATPLAVPEVDRAGVLLAADWRDDQAFLTLTSTLCAAFPSPLASGLVPEAVLMLSGAEVAGSSALAGS